MRRSSIPDSGTTPGVGFRWDLGGSTWGFYRLESADAWVPLSEAVRAIVASGLGVELWPTRGLEDRDPSEGEVARLRRTIAEAPFASVHMRDRYWSWSPDGFRREIDFSAAVGAKLLVIHPVCLGLAAPDGRLDVEETVRIADYGADHGVRIALENVRNTGWALDRVLNEIGDDPETTNLGICIDIGHAFLSDDLGDRPIDAYLERYRDQLVHLHLHDNDGVEDDHLPPGGGRIDWINVLRTLEAIGFDGRAILEVARIGEDAALTIQKSGRFLSDLRRSG